MNAAAVNGSSILLHNTNTTPTNVVQFYEEDALPLGDQLTAWTLRHGPFETALLCVAYAVVFVVGVLGNIAVIWIVMKTPQLRTTTNQFIVSLAAADLMVNCLCLPFTLVANLFKAWSMGKVLCKIVGFLQCVSVTASVITLMAIAVERCQVIRRPLIGGLTRRKCRQCIVALWLLATAVNVPLLYVFTLQPFPQLDALQMCVELWPTRQMERVNFLIVNMLLGYIGPLVVITGCYAFIWHKVAHRNMPGELMMHVRQMARNRLKATRMVLVVIITFAVSWLPLYIIFCVAKFHEQLLEIPWVRNKFYELLPVAQWLGATNSCINPLLYAYLNRRFRGYFLDTMRGLLCRCCSGDGNRRNAQQLIQNGSYLLSPRMARHPTESADSTRSTDPLKSSYHKQQQAKTLLIRADGNAFISSPQSEQRNRLDITSF